MNTQGIPESVIETETVRPRLISKGSPEVFQGKTGSTVPADTADAVKPVSPAKPSPSVSQDYSKELARIAEAIRKYVQFHKTNVDISVDEELQQIVTKVIDEDSGKVIRQVPGEAALEVMKHLKELRGLLVDRKG